MKDLSNCKDDDPATRNYYKYYDSPDGCDVNKKIAVSTRYGAIMGVIMSTHDVLMYTKPVGLGPIFRRFAFHMIPPMAMGATFVLVSNGVLEYRQKDDQLNYFLGGMACGPILAYYLGSTRFDSMFLCGLALGIAGAIKKDSILKNYTILPVPKPMTGDIMKPRRDYTLVSDPRDSMYTYSKVTNEQVVTAHIILHC